MSTEAAEKDKALFERISDDYLKKDLTLYSCLARKLRLYRTLKHIKKPIDSILELGCGCGFSARYLRTAYCKYQGVDYSANLISYAKEYNSSPHVDFVCADITEYVPPEQFQVIIMIGVLHHIPELEKVLLNLRKCLQKDGVIVVNEPQRGNLFINMLRRLRKKIDKNYSVDQVEFSREELVTLFERYGYSATAFSQGVFSTPFAEALIFPKIIGLPMSWLIIQVEPLFEIIINHTPLLQKMTWNVVIEARIQHSDG